GGRGRGGAAGALVRDMEPPPGPGAPLRRFLPRRPVRSAQARVPFCAADRGRDHGSGPAVVRGGPADGPFFRLPDRAAAGERLAAELSALRGAWPADRYWDSFHLDVCRA